MFWVGIWKCSMLGNWFVCKGIKIYECNRDKVNKRWYDINKIVMMKVSNLRKVIKKLF